jgi:hypothetical protein
LVSFVFPQAKWRLDEPFQAIQETGGRSKLAFFHPDYFPAATPQMARHLQITPNVSLNLSPPKSSRRFGGLIATRAAVPKASVNKQGDFDLVKNEVRLPEN